MPSFSPGPAPAAPTLAEIDDVIEDPSAAEIAAAVAASADGAAWVSGTTDVLSGETVTLTAPAGCVGVMVSNRQSADEIFAYPSTVAAFLLPPRTSLYIPSPGVWKLTNPIGPNTTVSVAYLVRT